jgi:hypothetical protein
MKNILGIVLLVSYSFSSCIGEESPVPPYVSPDGVYTVTIPGGFLYENQVYFRFKTREIVSNINRESWDIALEVSDNRIVLNSGRLMRASDLGVIDFTSFNSVPSTASFVADLPSLHPDSLAIKHWGILDNQNWIGKGHVYVVDLGFDTDGFPMGRKKIQILSKTSEGYRILVANVDNTAQVEGLIPLNNAVSYVYINLRSPDLNPVIVEPNKTEWDVMFGSYTSMVKNPANGIPEEYLVYGVLLNPYLINVATSESIAFANLGYSDIDLLSFSSQRDIIGYDWKSFDIAGGGWSIDAKKIYVLKDSEGFYYKIRFVGFLNSIGQKGFPAFEMGLI